MSLAATLAAARASVSTVAAADSQQGRSAATGPPRAPAARSDGRQFDSDIDRDATWTAPAGQTGDGRTALNDKLGY